MALSKQVSTDATLRDFLSWAASQGYHVGEHPLYGGVNPRVHRKGSWHGDGKAADLNWRGEGERERLTIALREAERRGLAVTYALTGTVGSAATHTGHLHVDVGEWSNYGQGVVKRKPASAAGAPVSSAHLRQVQARLNRDYPAYSRLVEDGIDGPQTQRVVKEFQRRKGLTVDGIAGPLTRKALGL